jgi:imidazolonepropionase-like amidohydrolase
MLMSCIVAACALGLAAYAPRPAARQSAVAIEHASVVPMDRDTLLADHTVVVVGDRIAWLGPSAMARVPAGARRIDGRGRFVLPGLADMHVHLDRIEHLDAHVGAGITTVRNMKGRPAVLAWRARIARGELVGPRIYTSGPSIGKGALPFGGDPEHVRVASEADAEAIVHEQRRAGYDMIKVLRRIERPAYDRLLLTARAARMPVVGHVLSEIGMAHSLEMGQASLEHAEPWILGGDGADFDAGARAIARAGAWVGTVMSARDGSCAPPTAEQRRLVGALRRARVKVLAGTDAGLDGIPGVRPGAALQCELSTLVAAGMTPYEALVAATREPGEFARLALGEKVPFGTIVAGASADLVLLSSDPRANIGAVARPIGTMLRGGWRPR